VYFFSLDASNAVVAAAARASYGLPSSATGSAAPATPGTLAHFLIERYVLYTASGEDVAARRVHHEVYPVQGARLRTLRESLSLAAGLPKLGRPPLAHYASGVDVQLFGKTAARQGSS
jgi:uncharacterized protein YqjF (DUF2071 family)